MFFATTAEEGLRYGNGCGSLNLSYRRRGMFNAHTVIESHSIGWCGIPRMMWWGPMRKNSTGN